MTTGAKSTERLAVRPGVIYSANGRAKFGLPAGTYTVVAGRGFEYGIDQRRITLKPGDAARCTLISAARFGLADMQAATRTSTRLPTPVTAMRQKPSALITVAGEGLELPVSTEHNKQIDCQKSAEKAGVRYYFTPIVGNEVTTPIGHINIFPVKAEGPVPDHKVKTGRRCSGRSTGRSQR